MNFSILIFSLVIRTEIVTIILVIIFLILILSVFTIIWPGGETRGISRDLFLSFFTDYCALRTGGCYKVFNYDYFDYGSGRNFLDIDCLVDYFYFDDSDY